MNRPHRLVSTAQACSSSPSPFIRSHSPDSPGQLWPRSSPQGTFSRSSTFCTNLHISSSSSSEAQKHLGNTLPFLPDPSSNSQPASAVEESARSPSIFSEDLSNPFDGNNVRDFFNLSGDASSDRGFHDLDCSNDSYCLSDQMELQFLSDELELAITDRSETPRLDEIYETPLASSNPVTGLSQSQRSLSGAISVEPVSSHPSPRSSAAANHKPRMRWTPELHESFLKSVDKLEGPEKTTPKAVLKLMNVEGLTIYHVKSHLQKYRLAKHIPEKKEEKKNVNSEEKKLALSNSEADERKKGAIQLTEALRMQMEVQKQLHEQLEVQRVLQLRIEEHAKYLEKMLEEQRKTGMLMSSSSSSSQTSDCQKNMSKNEESLPQTKNIASETEEDNCESPQKRRRVENKTESEDPER
ncbi:myb family transcription factor PHL6-like isoform X2 [Raphanus sativus]|uniref:Myb family transcription factor PHL6-like isoform X2 n=1 Tax=Raphanus sativus TaxID=3726 RepID=A0A9W3CPE3_RAPSA|nr:myb family transcription factor PHL6-like isoform X2 [Raphanus sativus]